MKPTTKFKTAAELGLTPKTYAALRWTLKLLRGDLKAHVRHEYWRHPVRPRGNLFNMATECEKEHDSTGHSCGTTACIGGWMAIHALGIRPNAKGVINVSSAGRVSVAMRNMAMNEGLYKLFYPGEECYRVPDIHNWSDITPKQAVKAIEYYLRTGEISWYKALVPPPKPPKQKTAKELGLTLKERAALVWTRDQLAAHKFAERAYIGSFHRAGIDMFNMNTFCHVAWAGHPCGTSACIGGWMGLRLAGVEPVKGIHSPTQAQIWKQSAIIDRLETKLAELFYPVRGGYSGTYADITSDQAVVTIDKYLLTGRVDWSHANG